MMLCAQPSSASVAEQGVCGWSKVGCIETEKRTALLTSKTNKLVNVNGWQWSLQQEKKTQEYREIAWKSLSKNPNRKTEEQKMLTNIKNAVKT